MSIIAEKNGLMRQNDDHPAGRQGPGTAAGQRQRPSGVSWDMDWNLLRTFMVIAEKNSITGAARQLGLKQPTVSNALRRLEDILGAPLAERDPRNFRLTRHGKALYRESREIFGSVARLPNLLASLGDAVEGHLTICMASHVTTPLLDEALARFHQQNPLTSFSISILSSREVLDTVSAKQATLGICLMREPRPNAARPELDTTLFYRQHFGFFCGPTHPLFGSSDLTLEDLREHERVTFATDALDDVLHPVAELRVQARLSERVAGISNNLEEVRRMIVAGLGYGPLPIHVVERDIEQGRLWQLPPYRDTPAVDISLVSHPRANLNAAESAFLHALRCLVERTPLSARTYGKPQAT
jgi:DNA-binding transcriptional LysR family regulator